MKIRFTYNPQKDQLLRNTRGIGFEEIIDAFHHGGLLANLKHPNQSKYPNQYQLVVSCKSYVYVVPYVREKTGRLFLKTIYPNRKYTKQYLKEKI